MNAVDAAGIITKILEKNGWTLEMSNAQTIQATGNGFRNSFDLRTWSELMTFEIDQNEISINSICNPDSMAQAFSFGKNRQNMRDFEMLFLRESGMKNE